MPDTVVTASPFIPVKPLLKIGATGSAVSIECAAEQVTVEVNQDDVTTETFCGQFKSYKAEEWLITASVFPSYGTTGLWNNLRPLCNTSQPFEFRPDGVAAAGPNNPSMTGTARVKGFSFYDGKLGEPQAFDVELAVQGTPAFALTLMEMQTNFAAAEQAAKDANAAAVNGNGNGAPAPAPANGGTTPPNGGTTPAP